MIPTNAKRSFNCPSFFNLARFIVMTKLSKLMICLLAVFGLIHFTMHYFVLHPESVALRETDLHNEDTKSRNIKHIEELEKIRRSAASELRELESRIHTLQKEITGLQSKSVASEKESKSAQSDLESLKRQILQTKNERLEMMHQNPRLPPPVRLLPSEGDNVDLPPTTRSDWCGMYNCFDYSRCSITSQFPVYVYPPSNVGNLVWPITPYILDASVNAILGNPYVTSDPTIACLYIVIMGEVEQDATKDRKEAGDVQLWLSSLPYWRGDGRNHVIVHMARQTTNQNLLLGVNTGRAIIAQSSYRRQQFRDGFDIVLPSLISTIERTFISKRSYADGKDMGPDDPGNVIPQVPVSRQYFLTFSGQRTEKTAQDTGKSENEREDFVGDKFDSTFLDALKEMSAETKHGKMYFKVSCNYGEIATKGYESEWDLCGSTESRLKLLADSTFSLILAPDDHTLLSTTLLTTRLAESLHSGAVPVILGTQVVLPFNEHIDWTKAAILFPKPRITELAFLLSSFPHSDIAALRRRGKFLYDTYFASPKAVIDAILSTLRTRINIPPLPVQDEISAVVEHRSYVFDKDVAAGDAQSEFALPPPEGKIDSPKFTRNFTCITIDAKDMWNKAPGPFQLYPSTPYDRVLSSDAKFVGSSAGFQPIGEGYGGVGAVFQQSLGGNVPREQFTIVMLTYEREEVMLQSLQRLKGLPYLNKVILVWNSPNAPPDDLQWPDIEVEVVVVRPKRNSLNNRFLPFNEIETDAVLSIDDDAHLRHDEILFSFRVWREQRDRIVGFPGRYHAWDLSEGRWKYNSEYCCELSMVLTGAAFFHKYYMHMYSHWMPQEIRDKVDELMNCEDIAMNFLVSHLTRAPPVKVTSRWTFRCPGCPEALSQSQSHFDERHVCINYFVKVFGYMPLLGTQFRVDSILFKTRLPHDKQKCFKFI